MKTSDSKSRSGYSQRPHIERKMVCCTNGFLPHRNLGHGQGLWAYGSAFLPGTPSHLSPGVRVLLVKLLPYLMIRVPFWHLAEEKGSSNIHVLRKYWKLPHITLITCAIWGATVFWEISPHSFLNQTYLSQMPVGSGWLSLAWGLSCPWQRQSAGFWISVCLRVT